jgi:hypothetical protein
MHVLLKSGSAWLDKVPAEIRNKCHERRSSEGAQHALEAYFDLIDYKKIMAANWDLFKPLFEAEGIAGGKNKILHGVDKESLAVKRLATANRFARDWIDVAEGQHAEYLK